MYTLYTNILFFFAFFAYLHVASMLAIVFFGSTFYIVGF